MMISKAELVPELRFPEFEGDESWREYQLGEISEKIFDGTHQTPSYIESGIPFFSVENIVSGASNKFISQRDYLEATKVNKPEYGDIIITRIGNIGFSKYVDWDYDFSIYVTLAIVKQSKKFDSRFLSQFFQSSWYQKEILSKSLLNAAPQKINMSDLRSTRVLLPPHSNQFEQRKIADCLSSLDDLIKAEGEKLKDLRAHKKGLMQNLFPKEGETTPRLRFPEFKNAGEWEDEPLAKLISNVTPPKKLQTKDYLKNGELPIMDQSPNHFIGYTDDMSAAINTGYPLIVFGDHTCTLKLALEPFAQGADGIKIFSGNAKIQTEFLYYGLQASPLVMKEYRRHFSILKEKRVMFPAYKSGEQTRIADCLSSLDDLITAQSDKIGALKEHKKGLMQGLFPKMDVLT